MFYLRNFKPELRHETIITIQKYTSEWLEWVDFYRLMSDSIETNFWSRRLIPKFYNLLALKCYNQFSAAAMISVLTQINALPGTQIRSSIRDRNIQATAQNATLHVTGEIVTPFIYMLVVGFILGNSPVEETLKVLPYRWISILVNGERGGCMLWAYSPILSLTPVFVGEYLQWSGESHEAALLAWFLFGATYYLPFTKRDYVSCLVPLAGCPKL